MVDELEQAGKRLRRGTNTRINTGASIKIPKDTFGGPPNPTPVRPVAPPAAPAPPPVVAAPPPAPVAPTPPPAAPTTPAPVRVENAGRGAGSYRSPVSQTIIAPKPVAAPTPTPVSVPVSAPPLATPPGTPLSTPAANLTPEPNLAAQAAKMNSPAAAPEPVVKPAPTKKPVVEPATGVYPANPPTKATRFQGPGNSGIVNGGLTAVAAAPAMLGTFGRIKDRMALGEGFLDSVGSVLSDNVRNAVDNPMGVGSTSKTVEALTSAGDMEAKEKMLRRSEAAQQKKAYVPPTKEEVAALKQEALAPVRTTTPNALVAAPSDMGKAETKPQPSAAALTYAPQGNPGDVGKELEAQAKALKDAGATTPQVPSVGRAIPGTTPFKQEVVDPTGNDNRTRMTVPGKGFAEIQQTNATAPTGSALVDASNQMRASGRTQGGFSGAGTDAEAGRAMQDRAIQSQNADFNIAQMNKAADAERDTRAAKLGIDRGTLDRMEGRSSPAAQQAAAMQQGSSSTAPADPWARPGDKWGDAEQRRKKYDSLVNEAANVRGFGARKKAAQLLAAAEAVYAPVKDMMGDTTQRDIAAGNNTVQREQSAATRYNAQIDSEDKAAQRRQAQANADRSAEQQDVRLAMEYGNNQRSAVKTERDWAVDQAKLANDSNNSVINDHIKTSEVKGVPTRSQGELTDAMGLEFASGDYDTPEFSASAAYKSGKAIPVQIQRQALAGYENFRSKGNKSWIGADETHEQYIIRRRKEKAEAAK